jgi:hypothetical protein
VQNVNSLGELGDIHHPEDALGIGDADLPGAYRFALWVISENGIFAAVDIVQECSHERIGPHAKNRAACRRVLVVPAVSAWQTRARTGLRTR